MREWVEIRWGRDKLKLQRRREREELLLSGRKETRLYITSEIRRDVNLASMHIFS